MKYKNNNLFFRQEVDSGGGSGSDVDISLENACTAIQALIDLQVDTQSKVSSIFSFGTTVDGINMDELDSCMTCAKGSHGCGGFESSIQIAINRAKNVRNAILKQENIDPDMFEEAYNALKNNDKSFDFSKFLVNDVGYNALKTAINSFLTVVEEARNPDVWPVEFFNNTAIGLGLDTVGNAISALYDGNGFLNGLAKFGISEVKTGFSTYVKPGIQKWTEKQLTKILPNISSTAASEVAGEVLKSSLKNIAAKTAIGSVIDYGTSIVTNAVNAAVDGKKIDASTLKLGSTGLKTVVKGVCSVAGEVIGGPVGKKIGSAVGGVLSTLSVEPFKDTSGTVNEKWCGAAAVTTAVGAVAGGAAVTLTGAAVTAAAACACIPGPGWVAAGAILAGAAIGYAATAIGYKCSHPEQKAAKDTLPKVESNLYGDGGGGGSDF